MRLPKDILTGTMTKPRLFLCETDKKKICQLDTIEMSGSFKFNTYSELTFTVGRTYLNMITGETQVNPFYNKIEALRLVYLEGFGYFEIQDPEIVSDGIKEVKNVTAYSLEYTLSQKYLEYFYVNTGERSDIGVDSDGNFNTVVLFDSLNQKYSLLHLVLEKVYGWSIRYVDPSIAKSSRTFEISRSSVYDFIVQDICESFNCFAVFDTVNNEISLYAESLSTKRIGDGKTKKFTITPGYSQLSSVTINGYKTTEYDYTIDSITGTGTLIFDNTPESGAKIEITDGSQKQWTTDVYVTFDNLAQEVNISYSADNIKTVLTVKGSEDLDIREVNMGLPYITDISYYYSIDWMGKELYDVYTLYLQNYNTVEDLYRINSERILELKNKILYEEGRMALDYVVAENVTSTTVGTYYVRGGSSSNYYYTEVTLPGDWKANIVYYKIDGSNLDEGKLRNLYYALISYFSSGDEKNVSELNKLKDNFKFIDTAFNSFVNNLSKATSLSNKTSISKNFLNVLLNQLGLNLLKQYKNTYEDINLDIQKEQGYNNQSNPKYYDWYVCKEIIISSLENEVNERKSEISVYETEYNNLSDENAEISNSISMDAFFYNYYKDKGCSDRESKENTMNLLIRLSSFLREDEYTDNNFLITNTDSIDNIMKTKNELRECGRIELSKLCEPKLEFSMDMANIYALPEFEPIIGQFQLGNLINVAIRSDYIKRARLLAVDINFNDFSDFSCEFGELTNLRTPSSIHADLLANALTAGKSVTSNASYWNKGADLATSTDIKIQQGLLSTISGLYNSDQSITIDNNGILLRKVNDDGSFSPYQAWLTSNNILLSSDGFRSGSTPRMGLGEFTVDGTTFYGILAEAVLSGYIEGSTIVGGTINIGNGAFVVHSDGTVTMNSAGNLIDGYAKTEDVNQQIQDIINNIDNAVISDVVPSNPKNGKMWVNTSTDPYEVMIFNQPDENEEGEWINFSQQYGGTVYTKMPSKYVAGDLWILSAGEFYGDFGPGSILKADENLNWIDAVSDITEICDNINQYFEFNNTTGLKIGQRDQKFYTRITSQRMSFCENPDVESSSDEYVDPNEVVYIGNRSANIKNLVVEEHAEFNCNADFNGQINIGDAFIFKLESNGSLSLAVAQ